MFAALFDGIKGTTSGAPGTGSFTPNAAATGGRPWSKVYAGWVGVVRYDDGASWELAYSYWNGTTLTRPAAGFIDSSSGSQLSLSSSATAALVVSADEVETPLGAARMLVASPSPVGSWSAVGELTNNLTAFAGSSAGAPPLTTTNLLTEQVAVPYTSTTTANSRSGVASTTAHILYSTGSGRGGFECSCRFGASQLPTGPRLLVGLTSSDLGANEPSANSGSFAAFAKDSTDTNIQFMTRDGSTAGKSDTGIALAANGVYLARIWAAPGGGTIYGLLIRWDTGEIWFGSRTTNLPANGTFMKVNVAGALNGTNTGTAFIIYVMSIVCRGLI